MFELSAAKGDLGLTSVVPLAECRAWSLKNKEYFQVKTVDAFFDQLRWEWCNGRWVQIREPNVIPKSGQA